MEGKAERNEKMDYQEQYWLKHPGMHLSDSERKIEELKAVLPKRITAKTLLDVGCGAGEILVRLSHHLSAFGLGADISRKALDAAQSRSRGTDTSWIQADVLSLPFKQSAIELVIITDLLEHLAEPGLALAEVSRIGEALLLRMPIENNLASRLLMLMGRKEWERLERKYGHIHHFSVFGVFRLLKKGGFKAKKWMAFELPPRESAIRNTISRICYKLSCLLGLMVCGGFLIVYCEKE